MFNWLGVTLLTVGCSHRMCQRLKSPLVSLVLFLLLSLGFPRDSLGRVRACGSFSCNLLSDTKLIEMVVGMGEGKYSITL